MMPGQFGSKLKMTKTENESNWQNAKSGHYICSQKMTHN